MRKNRKNNLILDDHVRDEGEAVNFYGFTVKEGFEYGFLGSQPVVFTGMMTGSTDDPDVYFWVPDRRSPGEWVRIWKSYSWLYERANYTSRLALSWYLEKYQEEEDWMAS